MGFSACLDKQMSGEGILFKEMKIQQVNKYIHARIAFFPVMERKL